jgi:putative Holliday junction resolvase
LVVLALDIGDKRCGIAVSDAAGKIAMPVRVLPTNEVLSGSPAFKRIIQDYEPNLLVVGLPLSLSGEENQQAKRVKTLAERIASSLDLPLIFQDERLSSTEAKRILKEQGCTEKEMRGKIDMIAASIFLQAYLDATA